MKISGAPRFAHHVGRSSQATPAAVDNSAPLQTRPSSLIYWGRTVQIIRATSVSDISSIFDSSKYVKPLSFKCAFSAWEM
jgi:hypothetical protein